MSRNNRNTIRLTEDEFNRVITESVYNTLNEAGYLNSMWQGIKQGASNAWNKGLKTVANGVMQGYNGAQAQYYQNKNKGIDLMGAVNAVRGDIGGINQSAKGMYANALNNKNPQGVSTALNNINQQTEKLSQDTQTAIQNVNAFVKNSEKAKKYTDRLNRNGQQTTGGNVNQGNSGQTQQQNAVQTNTNTNTSKNGWIRDNEGNYVNQQTGKKLSPYDYHVMVTKEKPFSASKEFRNRRGRYNPMYQQENRMRKNQVVLSESDLHEIVRGAVNILMNENVDLGTFDDLASYKKTLETYKEQLIDSVTKYKGSPLAKKMRGDVEFNKFMNGKVWPFLLSLIAALGRCVKAKNLNEGVKTWALNTLKDSGFKIPQFIQTGVYDADRYGRSMAYSVGNRMRGYGKNGDNETAGSKDGDFGSRYVNNTRLKVLIEKEYPRISGYLEDYANELTQPDPQNPLSGLFNTCESLFQWWKQNYTPTN